MGGAIRYYDAQVDDARLVATLARTATLDLVLTGESTLRRVRTRPSDRLKFWRAAPFEQVLSE